MAIQIQREDGIARIRISEELNIYAAAALRAALLEQGAAEGPRHFDLSQVSEIDTAGLQLLLSALRPAHGGDVAGRIEACSPVVGECLQLCGLGQLLPAALPRGEH